jgi:hypothetical protein
MEAITFKRNPAAGIASIILSVSLGFLLILNLAIESPLAGVPAVLLVLNIGNAAWLFKTPFAVLLNGKASFNYSIAKKKSFTLSNLKNAKRLSETKLELTFINGKAKILNISGMHAAERNRFFNLLNGIKEDKYGPEVYIV